VTKEKRLRMTAEGFMAALVACGYRGPWRWSNMDWELPFYRVWRRCRLHSAIPTASRGLS